MIGPDCEISRGPRKSDGNSKPTISRSREENPSPGKDRRRSSPRQDYNITRLTLIKSLCSDPDAAAKFAVHIAKLAQRQFKARRPGDTKPTKRQEYGRLIAAAIPAMTRYLKSPTRDGKIQALGTV